jgi:hypothetical protein
MAESGNQFQETFSAILEEQTVKTVEDGFEHLLSRNLEEQLEELPPQMRDDLARSTAEIYGEQAREILNSTYMGQNELYLAMATAFIRDTNVSEIGVRTRALFRDYSEDLEELERTRYESQAFQVLTDPWPLQDLGTGVERFKDPEDDRSYY